MPRLLSLALLCVFSAPCLADDPKPLKLLFLGDNGHHRPQDRYRQLQPVLEKRGIDVVYTDKADALNAKTLAGYEGLIVYANIDTITADQEKALLDFVAGGKGFIPLHCASYCFRNSPQVVALIGAQFQRHNTGTFRTTIAEPNHPVMKGFAGFESWDETYVHTKHNEKDRVVLEYRMEGNRKEPWTWVRTHGKGRVFYTAWGHDDKTWGHPGFQNLVERGIRWAVGQDPSVVPAYVDKAVTANVDKPTMTAKRTDVKPFEYVPANVPFYPPSPRWGVTADPLKTMQKPLDTAESMKHFVTPTDFELKLFVDETKLGGGKPICMNWDERGRLWVAMTIDYPNNKQPEGQGHDRIVICEDTDGDGVCDKVTVFADKLSIPTSLTFYKGGIIVMQAPQTLYLKSTKGDDVADEKSVLFSGWSTSDTHAGPSNLHYGFDNWIYGIMGYAGFNGTVGGEQHRVRQGFYRFKPDGSKFEFLRNTNNNSWGVGFSEEGILFGSTANGNPSEYMPIPNRYYEAVRGWSSSVLTGIAESNKFQPITDKVRQVDWHGGFTAAAGHALYTARTYPKYYWNRTAFVAEPTGHLVATFEITPNGAGFRSRNSWNLVASDDEWSAPIMAEVGPDGNVWVIDWYNYIVQHNPTPPGFRTGKGAAYETDLRDKKHGRIYRLVAKNPSTQHKQVTLANATPEKLVETLKNDNMFWRLHAQRLLVERGEKDVVPALVALAKDKSVDEIGLNPGVIHALWTLHGLGVMDGELLAPIEVVEAALQHQSAGVRRNALLVMPRTKEMAAQMVEMKLLEDKDPQVRLAALLAISETPEHYYVANALQTMLGRDAGQVDRWTTDAAMAAAAHHGVSFLHTAVEVKGTWQPKQLAILTAVAEHCARDKAESASGLILVLSAAQPQAAEAILAGFTKGRGEVATTELNPKDEEAMVKLLPKLSPSARGNLLQLAERWGSKALVKHAAEVALEFSKQVKDEKATETARIAAAQQLIEFRRNDATSAKDLLELITPSTSPDFAQGLIDAVGRSEAADVGTAVIERIPTFTPSVRPAALRVVLGRADWTRTLLRAMNENKIHLTDLSLEQRRTLAEHPDRAIARQARVLLERGGGLPNADRQKVVDEFLPLLKKEGDPVAGKLVFKNNCAKCHKHSGEGETIGPDLTGVAVHTKEHLLIDILDPSRSVEGNFRVYTVVTKNGRVLTGLLASETKTAVEVIDAEAKRHTVLRQDIEELQASPKSLMPDGFEKQVKPEEIVNLLAFLTQRGKYLPIPLDKAATVVTTKGMFYSEDAQGERLVFSDWSPKTFNGVPFLLIDPRGDKLNNAILLYGPNGYLAPKMPRSVTVPCNAPAKTIHILGGVSGWGYPYTQKGSVTMIVRLHYADGKIEDHELLNGVHFADYIRVVDVPESKLAFRLRGQQLRYLTVTPKRPDVIKDIELVKGRDQTAPVVMAVTVEGL
jgi:putative membrane-bound dehydrogenase-like protein